MPFILAGAAVTAGGSLITGKMGSNAATDAAEIQANAMLLSGTYYWKVRANDGAGNTFL